MLPAFVDHKSNPNGQLSTLISFYFSGFSSINAVMNLSNSNTEFSRFPNSKEVNSEIGVSSEPLGFGKPAFGSVASSRSKPRLVKLRKPKGRMEAGGKNDSGFNPFRPGSDDSVPEMGSSVLGKLNFGHVGSSENFVFGGTKNTNVENSSGFLANKTLDDMGKLKIGSDQEVVSTSVSKSNGNDRGSFSHVGSFGKEIPVFGGAFNGSGIDESAVRKLPEEIGKLNIEGSANSGSSKNVRDVSSNLSAPNKTSFIFGSSDDAAKSFGISVASELPNELNKLNIGTGSSSLGRSSAATVLPEKTMNLNMKDPVNTYGGERKDDNFSANDQSGFVFSSNNRGSSGIFYGKADSMLSDEMEKLNIAKQGGDNTGQRQTCFAEDSMGNLGSKNSDDLFKPVRDFIEVPSVVRPEKKDEFNFTSSWNGMGTPHVEFTTPNLKGNIFPSLDKKLEFSAKLESTKDARSKKRRGKLKKPASAQPLFGLDFVFPKSSSQENPDSFDVYSPMDVSPYQEILADNKGSRETSVTSEEAFHPFINDASCESHQTVPNDATDEDLVFATQRMDINNDDRKCTQTEVGDSEYRFGKEDGARSPSPESVVGADSESFKTANEQLESSTDSFVTATDNEVSSRLRIERQESDEKMQFSFTSASEDVAGTSFMFAASSSLQGQSSAAMRHQKKKNRAKVVQESYSSSTPNTKVLPAPSSTQFFPNSDTTKLLSLRPQRGDLPSSLSSRRDKTEAAEQQESKQSSTPAASIAAQEACDKWRLRGNQAYANGDMSRAEDYYTQGVNCVSEKENSKSCLRALMLCYSNRAATRMSLGRMREALADCMQAAAVDPNFLRVQVRAANCYLALGEVEDASRHFMKCLQPGSEACVDRKLVLEASEGLKKAQKVSECMKQSAELLQQRTSSDAESALGVIAQALAISPYCEKLLEMKANALFMLRKFDELIQLCEQTLGFAEMNYPAISADSRSLNASFRVWRLRLSIKSYFYLGRLEDALDYLKKQEECVSTNKESESKTSASLIPLAGTITELVRHKTAGNEAFQSGRHTEAVEHYTAALSCTVESRPFAAVCFCNRAAAYMAMGQIVDAIADCSLAIALDGNYMKAISRRAILFEMIRDYDQAAADLQKLLSILMKKVEDKANQSGASDRSSSLNELRQAQQRLSAMEEEARKEIPLNMYLILGIDPSVVASEIKKAYRKAALRHHPDKAGQSLARSENGDDGLRKEVVEEVHKGADRLFKMIGEAYAVLSDPNKRSRYDLEEEMRNAQKRGNGGSASRMHADVQNYPFERSGSRRQWREVWRSYGNSQSRGSETNRSSRYP